MRFPEWLCANGLGELASDEPMSLAHRTGLLRKDGRHDDAERIVDAWGRWRAERASIRFCEDATLTATLIALGYSHRKPVNPNRGGRAVFCGEEYVDTFTSSQCWDWLRRTGQIEVAS